MWLAIILALYIFWLVCVWWFFIIARVHVYKFKQYSTHIVSATKLVFVILLVLTVIWFAIIAREYMNAPTISKTIKETSAEETY